MYDVDRLEALKDAFQNTRRELFLLRGSDSEINGIIELMDYEVIQGQRTCIHDLAVRIRKFNESEEKAKLESRNG